MSSPQVSGASAQTRYRLQQLLEHGGERRTTPFWNRALRVSESLAHPWVLVLLVALAWALPTQAYVLDYVDATRVRHWELNGSSVNVSTNVVNPKTHAIRYFIAADAYSTTNTAVEIDAVKASFAVWESAPSTLLRTEFAGLLPPPVDVDETDNTNVVFWAKNGTMVAGGTASIAGAVGMTYYASQNGVMVGADIVLNGDPYSGFKWFTDIHFEAPDSGWQFVEGTMTHEIGHLLGLNHSPLGGSTLYYRGAQGVNTLIGLSDDDIAGIQTLYPMIGLVQTKSALQGKVTLRGSPVFGAIVSVRDLKSGFVSATLTRTDGTYLMASLPPSQVEVHVSPLAPSGPGVFLTRGQDITPEYRAAHTAFEPTTNRVVVLSMGKTATLDFAVVDADAALAGDQALRVAGLRKPTTDPLNQVRMVTPAVLRQGDSNLILGVYSLGDLSGGTLSITGDGVAVTPLTASSGFPGLTLLSVGVTVQTNATPGLRTFMVRKGTNLSYAEGFLSLEPTSPDFNFDGLDDYFQRQYFSPWTRPEAGPKVDPDGDGFNNQTEFYAGSIPTLASSLPQVAIKRATLDLKGTTVVWDSLPGTKYQVYTRDEFQPQSPWRAIGTVVQGTGGEVSFLDATATNRIRFYEIQLLRTN